MSAFDVELHGVVKRFGTFTAVDHISLRVRSGQFVTLLGPSGCGKTTTLRMIGGFEHPDAGSIRIGGVAVSGEARAPRVTRMVFQNYALFPHMTVEANVAFGLRMSRTPKPDITRKVHAVLDLLGLTDQPSKYPRQLSGGQQQRVALARALVTDPKVLLLDEPLGALDLKMRKHMQNELKRLHREVGITFIYVTHDQEEAMYLSDSIVVMDRGRIVQQGSPTEIYERPVTAYVADFLGEANLIPGKLLEVSGAHAVVDTGCGLLRGCMREGASMVPGAPVIVSIRPEHVRIGSASYTRHATTLQGQLADVAFLGNVSRLGVQIGRGFIRVDVRGAFSGAAGDAVTLSWSSEDARILESDDRFMGGWPL